MMYKINLNSNNFIGSHYCLQYDRYRNILAHPRLVWNYSYGKDFSILVLLKVIRNILGSHFATRCCPAIKCHSWNYTIQLTIFIFICCFKSRKCRLYNFKIFFLLRCLKLKIQIHLIRWTRLLLDWNVKVEW